MDMMEIRRRIMMQNRNILPKEYRQVDYIENQNAAYINTSISGYCRFEITAKIAQNDIQTGTIHMVVSRGASGGQYFGYVSGKWSLGGGVNTTNNATTDWTDIVVDFASDGIATANVNNETISRGPNTNYSSNYLLFGRPSNSYSAFIAIKKCICYKDNAKIADLIPCVRLSDSKPGMYDNVSKTFFTNAGTGEFIIPT